MTYYLIIRGPLGCGKTTVSKKLAKILEAKYFSIDSLLEKYNLEKDKEEGYISQNSFKKVNQIIVPYAQKKLALNQKVIFDGNFYWRSQIENLVSSLNFPHYIFTLNAPLSVCINRDMHRKETHGQAATKAVYKKSTQFDYGFKINADQDLNNIIDQIIHLLPPN